MTDKDYYTEAPPPDRRSTGFSIALTPENDIVLLLKNDIGDVMAFFTTNLENLRSMLDRAESMINQDN